MPTREEIARILSDSLTQATALAAARAAVVKAAMDAWANRNAEDSLDYQFKCDAACADLKKLGG